MKSDELLVRSEELLAPAHSSLITHHSSFTNLTMKPMDNILNDFTDALLEFDTQKAGEILTETYQKNNSSFSVELIVSSLKDIGERWENGDLALSQIYMTGRICEELVENLLPDTSTSQTIIPEIAITTLGDYHLLGKKIVASVLRASGFNIIDFGHGIDTDTLVNKVIENKIKILLVSTLMLHSALLVKDVRAKLNKANYPVKILVGGAPYIFDNLLYKQVEADAMGKSPTEAIDIIKKWNDMSDELLVISDEWLAPAHSSLITNNSSLITYNSISNGK